METGTAVMVQTVDRCAEILNRVADHPEGMTLGEVAEAVGLKYPTVYNLVTSLAGCGLLEKDAENRLYPGRGIGVLNACRLRSAYLRQLKRMAEDLDWNGREHTLAVSVIRDFHMEGIAHKGLREKQLKFGRYDFHLFDTVAGIVFFTFLPEQERRELMERNRNAPEFRTCWGTEERLRHAVELCRKNGYSLHPMDKPQFARIGVPVYADGKLFAALTWGWAPPEKTEIGKVLDRLRNLPELSAEIRLETTPVQA